MAAATGTGSAPEYQWQLNGADVPGATAATFSLPAPRAGDRVRVRLRSNAACVAAPTALSNELLIAFPPAPAPAVTIGGAAAVCAGEAVRLRRTGPANAAAGAAYQWLLDGTPIAGARDSVLVLAAPRDGQLVALEVRTPAPCGAAATAVSNAVRLRVAARPDVDAGPDQDILAGESVRLAGRAAGRYHLAWTPAEGLSFAAGDSLRPVAAPTRTTTYTLRAAAGPGCWAESQVTVEVRPGVVVPNAISPNGDARNNTWRIDGLERYPANTVTVFDRWGGQVFHAAGYNRGKEWDGTRNGRPVPVGTYYYSITLGNGKALAGPLTVVY